VLGSSRIESSVLTDVAASTPGDVDAAVASGMLKVDADGLTFRHELAQVAIAQSLAPTERRRLNRRALDVLRQLASA
jgi:hypothetical protein